MEHPVPQNIASFEFHLVGDMTLKQFAYLGSGLGFSYLIFVLLFTPAPYLAIPIIAFSSLFGVALAFLPILDRPFDHWVMVFFKSIYSPTKGMLQTTNGKPLTTDRLQLYLSATQTQPTPSNIQTTPNNIQPTTPILTPQPAIQPPPDGKKEILDLIHQSQLLQDELNMKRKEVEALNSALTSSGPIIPKAPKTIVVNVQKPIKTQMTLTTFPNVINGVVEDFTGSYLDGVIVIIHNKEGIPVRALKTNKLGQFSGATPLPSGVYTVTLEKDNYQFDALQIILSGEVLAPLTIRPKIKK